MDSLFNSDYEKFTLIYEYQSLSSASRSSGQDIAGLSRSLARLESRIGKKLFSRVNTGLIPTMEGTRLMNALSAGKQLFDKELANFQNSEIKIGFSSTVGFGHFNKNLLRTLKTLNLSPQIQILPTPVLFEKIKTRELDLILAPKKLDFPEVINTQISTDSVVLVSQTGESSPTLLCNHSMLEVERVLKQIKFESKWDLEDYFVMAKFISLDPRLMGLIPFSLLETFPKLKIIQEFHHVGKVHAISWRGSAGAEFLKILKQSI